LIVVCAVAALCQHKLAIAPRRKLSVAPPADSLKRMGLTKNTDGRV